MRIILATAGPVMAILIVLVLWLLSDSKREPGILPEKVSATEASVARSEPQMETSSSATRSNAPERDEGGVRPDITEALPGGSGDLAVNSGAGVTTDSAGQALLTGRVSAEVRARMDYWKGKIGAENYLNEARGNNSTEWNASVQSYVNGSMRLDEWISYLEGALQRGFVIQARSRRPAPGSLRTGIAYDIHEDNNPSYMGVFAKFNTQAELLNVKLEIHGFTPDWFPNVNLAMNPLKLLFVLEEYGGALRGSLALEVSASTGKEFDIDTVLAYLNDGLYGRPIVFEASRDTAFYRVHDEDFDSPWNLLPSLGSLAAFGDEGDTPLPRQYVALLWEIWKWLEVHLAAELEGEGK